MRSFFLLIFLIFSISNFAKANERLFVDDPQVLNQLEAQGFDLSRLVFGETTTVGNNEQLIKNSSYAFIAKSLGEDLEQLKKEDPKLFISMKSSHRLFDPQWLIANYATYELVGIINRTDRLSFHNDTCGEIRFIYRLAYKTLTTPSVYSRLPMTMNAVFWIPKSSASCQAAAQQWQSFLVDTKKDNFSKVSKSSLTLGQLKSIEVNMQSVRWPSTIRPDMAGYAEYLLRVFTFQNDKLSLSPLENTPDVTKINSDKKLRKEFTDWIKDKKNLKAIDDGIAIMPNQFLAKRATSVALHGVHRKHNALFNQIVTAKDFSEDELKDFSSFKNSAGLLKRLNDLSCVGCHQGRTVAGFHFLGKDKSATDAVNSIFTSSSPHFLLDQPRRALFTEAVLKKQNPTHRRPLSVRADSGEGKMGSHCGLGNASFTSWTCSDGFECKAFTEDQTVSPTGICVPVKKISGSPCTTAQMIHNVDPKKDGLKQKSNVSCDNNAICEASSVGFPNGMCSSTCDQLKPGETCGSIAILNSFNDCLAVGKKPFAECLAQNVRPASMQECDSDKFCRDDYICAKTIHGKGSCIPPYFLFQLRVDGHPSPGLKNEKFTFVDSLRKLLPD